MRRVSLLASEQTHAVCPALASGRLTLSTSGGDAGEASESLDAAYTGEPLRVATSIPVEILAAGQGWKVGRSRWKIENGAFNVLTRDHSLTHNYHPIVAAIVALLAMRSFACFRVQAYWNYATARSRNAPYRFLRWFQQVVIEDGVRYLDRAWTQPDQPSP